VERGANPLSRTETGETPFQVVLRAPVVQSPMRCTIVIGAHWREDVGCRDAGLTQQIAGFGGGDSSSILGIVQTHRMANRIMPGYLSQWYVRVRCCPVPITILSTNL
jgi:hypothetical protein